MKVFPEKNEKDVAHFIRKYRIPKARRCSRKYPLYKFKIKMVRRMPIVLNETLTKIKSFLSNLLMSGAGITQKAVISS